MDFSELMRRIQEEAQPPVVVLELWVNDDSVFVNPDLQDPIVIVDYANLFAFAAMDPVVDLESLRGVHTVT